MGQRHPSAKEFTGRLKSVAHVAKEEEFGRRDTLRVRRNPAFADVDSPVGKQLAQMIVGPAVAESELEHVSFQFGD
jgi:hypothetical protein